MFVLVLYGCMWDFCCRFPPVIFNVSSPSCPQKVEMMRRRPGTLSLQLGLGLNRMGGSLSLEASESFDKNDGITR